LGNNITTDIVTLYPGKTANVNQVELSMISASLPPTPTLDECIVTDNHRVAITPCNKRGEVMMNRIGEIQCNSIEEAQGVSRTCLSSDELVSTQIDDNGNRCHLQMMNPELSIDQ